MLINRFLGTHSTVTKAEAVPGGAVYTVLCFWQPAVQTANLSPINAFCFLDL